MLKGHPVIIVGGDGSNGLGIARTLGRRGIDVYCISGNRSALMLYSKYCTRRVVRPGIERDPAALSHVLTRLARQLPQTGVIFPTGDNALRTLSTIITEVDQYATVMAKRAIIETFVVKKHFYRSLAVHGIPHPRTQAITDTDVEAVTEQFTFPVFIRPSQSARFTATFGSKGFVAHTVRDLRTYIQLADQYDLEVMIQELVPGPTSNGYKITGYFDHDAKPLVLFAVQKIRQPHVFADYCVNRSIPWTHIADVCTSLVQYLTALGYHGVFGAEYKRDSRDGQVKLLEINARSMGGNAFATACGANYILAAYRDMLGEPVKPVTHYTTGVYGINIVMDTLTLLGLAHRGRLRSAQSNDLRPYVRKHAWFRLSKEDMKPFLKGVQRYWARR